MSNEMIRLFRPTFDVDACLAELRDCLEQGWTGPGFKTDRFEEEWKAYIGLKNAYFVNSCTAALNLTFEVFKDYYGWANGDEVITTPITFVSSNHAILLAGLKPVLTIRFACLLKMFGVKLQIRQERCYL
jgi:dTDP-4-amino-4,6-dideoxygalactose transaminase